MLRKHLTPRFALLALLPALLAGCSRNGGEREDLAIDKLFTLLPSSYSGIEFENRLTDTEEFNVFTYRNYYNGGGVGIGDVNGDGLPDIYLTANQLPNRLYLNRGGFQFEDVTGKAGVAGKGTWSTGVSMADVNGDGLLDIYVSNAGNVESENRANELFINKGVGPDGVPTFEEAAAAYGIADEGFTTHAAFFDYDKDGDLDLYVLNNSPRPVSSFGLRNIRHVRHEYGGHKFYRNEDGRFTDVSEGAGIYGSEIAFGLGATVGDVNRDGWLDIYISNDFFERDYLYLNNGDGTFKEVLEEQMPYISLSSMGADMADVNNDGYPEIFVTDMLPEDDRRLKTTSAYEGWDVTQQKLKNGYYHQYMRNMLHLNNANGTFTEIGQFAGVSATDWSWSALIADFDNDGNKDIFVSNGVYKDVTDQDFIDFFANELNKLAAGESEKLKYSELLEHIPSNPIPNYIFAGNGDLTFTNRAAAWGLDAPGFSNGSAYGDLDNDGDLDLIVSNVNQELSVYRNEADTLLDNNYLKVKLEGEGTNRFGIGAKVTLRSGDESIYLEQMPFRGFQSSVDPVLTAGLGKTDTLDALVVEWPDNRVQVLTNVAANQLLILRQKDAMAGGAEWTTQSPPGRPVFANLTESAGLDYTHVENRFIDFDRERLIPKMLSTEGPRMAVADVNGDGLEDVFIGGAKEKSGSLFLQQRGGGFVSTSQETFTKDAISEDVGAVFFDAEGDGDMDLYVVSGGNEYGEMAPGLQDRLYINIGGGRFEKVRDRLPAEYASGSCVVAADYDGDGDVDLFVGGRVVPWKYGVAAESAILQNDGRGYFKNVTQQAAPELAEAGMVTDAVWTDYDADGRTDLVLTGEWMPIMVFQNTGSTFKHIEAAGLEKSHGWWNKIVAEDFDSDGDIDFVTGNLGLNQKIRASASEPATMHVGDFDGNGSVEQIISTYNGGESYPILLRDDLLAQLPSLEKKYLTYTDYAGQSVTDIFSTDQLQKASVRHAYTLATSYIENLGGGTFAVRPLPTPAQFAPVYAILPSDFDGDGNKDLLLGGNFYGVKPDLGRMDGSYGLLLRGDGKGGFQPVPPKESGFFLKGQVRDMKVLNGSGKNTLILVSRNNDRLEVFKKL